MRAIVMALAIAGCAHPQKASPATESFDPALIERSAAVIDAATHDDILRLKTMVDWDRYRVIDLARAAEADRALGQLEAEPHATAAYIDVAVIEIGRVLKALASGPTPPRARPRCDRRTAVADDASPSVKRLHALSDEALAGRQGVAYEGVGRVCMLFVGQQLVAVVQQ